MSLSSTPDNARYLNPSGISISATASGPELNDIIASVAFYLNGSLAQTVSSAPFSYNASGLAVGTYTLTAVATDSQGAQTTSAARTFTVSNTNVPPTVSLVIPQDNTRWNAPATVTFQASVNSGEANDTVSVEFFANGVSQGVRTSSPFSLTQSLAAATYTITAVATDGQGAQTTSAARTITVSNTNNPPTVSISSPAPNANFPTAPASFTLSASANSGEINGWITKVDFYVNGTLVNTDTSAPYSYAVSGLANGTYSLTAVATDQLNAQTTSAPVVISVGVAPLAGYFIHTDHLNTPRAIYDGAQQVRWKWDQQESFGVSVPDENPGGAGAFEFPGRFAGQHFDKETGNSYNGFRDYAPSLGRYVESDPIGSRTRTKPYAYAGLDPLTRVDPAGLLEPNKQHESPPVKPPPTQPPPNGGGDPDCFNIPPWKIDQSSGGIWGFFRTVVVVCRYYCPPPSCPLDRDQYTYEKRFHDQLQIAPWLSPCPPKWPRSDFFP